MVRTLLGPAPNAGGVLATGKHCEPRFACVLSFSSTLEQRALEERIPTMFSRSVRSGSRLPEKCSTAPGSRAGFAISTAGSSLPADAVLFVRNLQCLKLDALSDWPQICDVTFSAGKEATARQKDRIKAAEWVLFRLFELWDGKETRSVCCRSNV